MDGNNIFWAVFMPFPLTIFWFCMVKFNEFSKGVLSSVSKKRDEMSPVNPFRKRTISLIRIGFVL